MVLYERGGMLPLLFGCQQLSLDFANALHDSLEFQSNEFISSGVMKSVTKKTGGFARFYRLVFWVSFSVSRISLGIIQ